MKQLAFTCISIVLLSALVASVPKTMWRFAKSF